jgi:hypothetical protein
LIRFQLLNLLVSFDRVARSFRDKSATAEGSSIGQRNRIRETPGVERNLREQAGRTPTERHQTILDRPLPFGARNHPETVK